MECSLEIGAGGWIGCFRYRRWLVNILILMRGIIILEVLSQICVCVVCDVMVVS
jgi:hypothetical protein